MANIQNTTEIEDEKDRRCRKRIGEILKSPLVGFRDDNPEAATAALLERLKVITKREKESAGINEDPTTDMVHPEPPRSHDESKKGEDSRNVSTDESVSKMINNGVDFDNKSVEDMGKVSRNVSTDESVLKMIIGVDSNDQSVENREKVSRNISPDEPVSKTINGVDSNDQSVEEIGSVSRNGGLQNPLHESIPNVVVNNDGRIMEFINRCGGTEAGLVIEKRLTESDVSKKQCRLLIPVSEVKNPGFLTEDEKKKLENKGRMKVYLFDHSGRSFLVNFEICKMPTESYALRTAWNTIVYANGLKEDMLIQVWSFRHNQELSLAFVIKEKEKESVLINEHPTTDMTHPEPPRSHDDNKKVEDSRNISQDESVSKMINNTVYFDNKSVEDIGKVLRNVSPYKSLSETIKNGVGSKDQSVKDKDSRNECLQNPLRESIPNAVVNNDGGIMDFIKFYKRSEAPGLVIQKRLTKSDVSKKECRLLIPVSEVKNPGFLTEDEKKKLENKEKMKVFFFDPERRGYFPNFEICMRPSECYALRTAWNTIVFANGLEENMLIQVWSFRLNGELCFTFARV